MDSFARREKANFGKSMFNLKISKTSKIESTVKEKNLNISPITVFCFD